MCGHTVLVTLWGEWEGSGNTVFPESDSDLQRLSLGRGRWAVPLCAFRRGLRVPSPDARIAFLCLPLCSARCRRGRTTGAMSRTNYGKDFADVCAADSAVGVVGIAKLSSGHSCDAVGGVVPMLNRWGGKATCNLCLRLANTMRFIHRTSLSRFHAFTPAVPAFPLPSR